MPVKGSDPVATDEKKRRDRGKGANMAVKSSDWLIGGCAEKYPVPA
jgi:hypothetical protein